VFINISAAVNATVLVDVF